MSYNIKKMLDGNLHEIRKFYKVCKEANYVLFSILNDRLCDYCSTCKRKDKCWDNDFESMCMADPDSKELRCLNRIAWDNKEE